MATRRASALNADAATKPGAAQSSRDGALKHSAYAVSNACSRTPASRGLPGFTPAPPAVDLPHRTRDSPAQFRDAVFVFCII
jgi:hypothetical protein